MSLKLQSLGRSAAATTRCLLISSTTNATPIVATLNAGHGLKPGDRIAVANITGNTAANGIWTLGPVTGTTAVLLNSSGNGVHGGAPKVGVVFDKTPMMRQHSAVMSLYGNLVGEVQIEAFDSFEDFAAGNNKGGTALAPVQSVSDVGNTNGNPTSLPASSFVTLGATTQGMELEVRMALIMSAITTATFTSGAVSPVLSA